ncbi:hypothetical protein ONS95_008438 [Cadophora gregata]|uniref:uncharacterized protein n=1 Tax=Cadophora gregata TaxID=51156 RepID=UPI0026DCF883|nr:uncharacterized protein ONS95_008438 [Cadophora gregata]KAK0100490.1 hypothetical protein ONS96_007765 [Cadophora gregata f. sp. sojae]KAK0126860.1 hypothetical protein ONS95_008438 [Cadophora gregata]
MKYVLSTLVLATLAAGDCAADNCLRALRATQTPGRLSSAREFCSTFTAGSVAATAIPSYALNACKQNQNGALSVRLSSACNCIAATSASSGPSITAPPSNTASATSVSTSASASLTEACALVSSSSSVQRAASPSATPTVAAQLAHDCLNSVPLNKTAALQLVDSMVPYIEWQSDTAWKKNPPADYFYPPHDIFGYLASVKANLQANKYANEYEFQEDLYQVFARGHDGHFVFYPDALTKAFEWGRKRSLVSISEDGTSLPVIKLYEDVKASPSTASVVTQINGVEASKYVADFIYTASFNQDADAAYNTMFYEKAFEAGGTGTGYFSAGGRIRYIYPGSNTTFTFANGTTLVTENIAKVKGLFSAVTDGASFYQRFCTGPKSFTGADAAEVAEEEIEDEPAAAEVVNPGYPAPILITSDGIVSGYYLNGTGFEDVAVISLLAFESESIVEFQTVAQDFFAAAKRDGKTKLVVDLSANGGGYILQGYDLFRQLFPSIVQDGYSRWRESDTFLAIAEIYSANSANFDPDTASADIINQYESVFNYRYDLNLTNQPFLTFQDKFGPNVIDGVNYTEIMRWNLDDPLTTSNDTFGLGTDVTGYRSRKNFTQPFEAENIIMLLDGYCASTCTLFTEFMRTQAGVKSIAMGGRPQPGPIQGVGGIKGAQILAWSDIFQYANSALRTASAAQAAILNRLTSYPINRASSSGVNVRDNILPGNLDDGLPAQFVREEADCRLFYTLDMVNDVTALWKAAANAAFNGGKCVAGGISKRSAGNEIEAVEKRRTQTPTMKKPLKKRSSKSLPAEWVERHGRKVIQ